MAKGKKMAEEKNVRFGSSPALEDRRVPSFFKVIFDRTLQEKKMMIPPLFSRDYNDVFLDEANLIVPNCHAWKVGLSKSDDAIFFDQNWSDFMEHYSIHLKHILIFDFRGSSTFHVRMFNPSGCEMHYPSNATQREPENNNISSISLKARARNCDFVDGECSKRPTSSKKLNQGTGEHGKNVASSVNTEPEDNNISSISLKGRARNRDFVDEECSKRPTSSRKLNQGTREHGKNVASSANTIQQNLNPTTKQNEAEAAMNITSQRKASAIYAYRKFKTKRPRFNIIIGEFHLRYHFAYVPTVFSRVFLKEEVSKCVKLQDPNGREWQVRLYTQKNKRWRLGNGWKAFKMENDLQAGDVCVFELANKNVFHVTIFRDEKIT